MTTVADRHEAAVLLLRVLDLVNVGALMADTPQDRRMVTRIQGVISGLVDGRNLPPVGSLSNTKRRIGIIRPMQAVGYLRVSTAEQGESGLGLEAQRQAIKAACVARGWTLAAIYEDRSASGRSLARAGLTKALEAVESGEAEGLVVAKLDRISRSVVDFASLMERSRKRNWGLVALDLGVDTTTPSGELVANVMASVAQWERQVIGQRTKDALAVKKQQGVRLGRPRSLDDRVVRRIVRERKAGRPFTEIAERLNRAGVPTAQGGMQWYPATVRKVWLSAQPDDR
jgi:DNA invertase Pin-like site-specific DNA recombinase